MNRLGQQPAEASDRATDPLDAIELPFVRNIWYVAGWSSEFGPSPEGREITDEPIVFYRNREGTLIGLADRCPHRWAPLSLGRVEGNDLRCMYHGLKFGPDGRCLEIPGQHRVAAALCVRTYPVIERHGFAWIWMGDAARADATLIPDLRMLDQNWRRIYRGCLDYETHYSLITDNLLDLSHISFLHERSVGRTVEARIHSDVKPYTPGGAQAKEIERGVRVEGWVCGPQSLNVLLPESIAPGDLWTRTDFLVPGIFVSEERMYSAGTAELCAEVAPPMERVSVTDSMSIQAVTPLTRRRTRYFYSFGPRASDLEKRESDAMWRIVKQTFQEDLRMIQAQQHIIDTHPVRRMYGIAADRGLTLFRGMMKKLVTAERTVVNPKTSGSAS